MTARAFSLSVPMTTRSGFMKSSTAAPSFRNSGLLTTSKGDLQGTLFEFISNRGTNLVGGADRHRGFVDNNAITRDTPADVARRSQHVLQIG